MMIPAAGILSTEYGVVIDTPKVDAVVHTWYTKKAPPEVSQWLLVHPGVRIISVEFDITAIIDMRNYFTLSCVTVPTDVPDTEYLFKIIEVPSTNNVESVSISGIPAGLTLIRSWFKRLPVKTGYPYLFFAVLFGKGSSNQNLAQFADKGRDNSQEFVGTGNLLAPGEQARMEKNGERIKASGDLKE